MQGYPTEPSAAKNNRTTPRSEAFRVLLEAIRYGAPGVTVDRVEGGSVTHTTGYYVGGDSWSMVRKGLDENDVLEYLQAHAHQRYVGYWRDDNGRGWLDVTTWHESLYEASAAALDRGEMAFWDIENNQAMVTE